MTSSNLPQGSCERCGGTGKLRYDEDHLDGRGEVVGHTIGTRACPCVRDLPPIEDVATWWESEVVWQKVWNDSIHPDSVVEITVSAEVPRNGDGRRTVMRGNRYYPTMVEVDLPERLLMHPFQAREFALKLMAAAGAADAIDEPCCGPCGHWIGVCDCEEVARA